jgi:hypothetical protein
MPNKQNKFVTQQQSAGYVDKAAGLTTHLQPTTTTPVNLTAH